MSNTEFTHPRPIYGLWINTDHKHSLQTLEVEERTLVYENATSYVTESKDGTLMICDKQKYPIHDRFDMSLVLDPTISYNTVIYRTYDHPFFNIDPRLLPDWHDMSTKTLLFFRLESLFVHSYWRKEPFRLYPNISSEMKLISNITGLDIDFVRERLLKESMIHLEDMRRTCATFDDALASCLNYFAFPEHGTVEIYDEPIITVSKPPFAPDTKKSNRTWYHTGDEIISAYDSIHIPTSTESTDSRI